jgi:hypothetical protein
MKLRTKKTPKKRFIDFSDNPPTSDEPKLKLKYNLCFDSTDETDASINLITEMLKHGANVKGLFFDMTQPPFNNSSLARDFLMKLLMSYGAFFR